MSCGHPVRLDDRPGVVAETADRVAVMHRGRIVETGPVDAVIENPQHPYTRDLLDAVPRFGRRRTGRKPEPVNLPTHTDGDVFHAVSEGHFVLGFGGSGVS